MEEYFLGKYVEVIVTQSMGFRESGVCPIKYRGTILSYDEKYYKMSVEESIVAIGGIIGSVTEDYKGIILLNKQYVVSIKEV